MELRQLRYLVALADEQHFTRAAAREHIAQPALSQQIRRLEQEVGLALVERTTRRVTVTEAGQTLVARARRILSELDAANAEMQALAGRSGHAAHGGAQRRALHQLPRGRPAARAPDLRGPACRLRAPDQARVQRERADQAPGGARDGGGDPPPLRRRAPRYRGRGG